jgi:hypothetical protein
LLAFFSVSLARKKNAGAGVGLDANVLLPAASFFPNKENKDGRDCEKL